MKILKLLLWCIIFSTCKPKEKVDVAYVIGKFRERADTTFEVSYNLHRIDTFVGGNVWDHHGFALLEKRDADRALGFSFYAKRNDVREEFLLDQGHSFVISTEQQSYDMGSCHPGFLGSPGGQMVTNHIFFLDTLFSFASLEESGDQYILHYQFEDDTTYLVTSKTKTIALDKVTFMPTRVVQSSVLQGEKSSTHMTLSDVKINRGVQEAVSDHKNKLVDYRLKEPEARRLNPMLHKKFPPAVFSGLSDSSITANLEIKRLTLLDFWQVWCGPCIAALPKIESLSVEFGDRLQVVGVVTESKEKALMLLHQKKITFPNYMGNDSLLAAYHIGSFPTYFLVDKDGIIQKEYTGFSSTLENDIRAMLAQ